jgi:hypothetical protein
MPSVVPTSTLEQPCAISFTIWSWRSEVGQFSSCRHGADATTGPDDELSADGSIRLRGAEAADEARLVPAAIRIRELVLR